VYLYNVQAEGKKLEWTKDQITRKTCREIHKTTTNKLLNKGGCPGGREGGRHQPKIVCKIPNPTKFS